MPRLFQRLQKAIQHRTGQNDSMSTCCSRETLGTSAHVMISSDSPFFSRLPGEIRRSILAAAFWKGIVHLQFPSSLSSEDVGNESQSRLTRLRHAVGQGRPPAAAAPSTRLLLSCVCLRETGREPVYDDCLAVDSYSDSDRQQPPPRGLGVMGWLLSCHQAHTEGIEVLLTTNTFHIVSSVEPLGQLLSMSHLALIHSIEIVQPNYIELKPAATTHQGGEGDADVTNDPGAQMVRNLMAGIATTLPNVKRVYLALRATHHGQKFPARLTPATRYRHYRDRVMPLMDRLVREYAQEWDELELGLPVSFYHAYREMNCRPQVRRYHQMPGWASATSEQKRQYPLHGYHERERLWRDVTPDIGYWVSKSWDDMWGQPWMVMDPWWDNDDDDESTQG